MIDHHVAVWAVLAFVIILMFLRFVEGYSSTGEKKCSYM